MLRTLKKLQYSRKALIATVDAVFSIMTILTTAYFSPDDVNIALAIIAVLQPVVIAWITAIAKEDAAEKSAKVKILTNE